MQLCEPLTKRRRLQQELCQSGAPITKECDYDPNLQTASCDMTGLVEQVLSYQVLTTATKEDGTRKSATGMAKEDGYKVPPYP